MASYQDVLDAVAVVVGGTAYAPSGNAAPKFYSGYLNGDSTGISGLHGAYSSPPATIQDPPIAVILPGDFNAQLNTQGMEVNEDFVLIRVFVSPNDPETQYPNLTAFRDSFPVAFRAKMQLNNTLNVSSAFITKGKTGIIRWGGEEYIGYDFTLRVLRLETNITYTP